MEIGRAKIMSPFRDAVGFIDSNTGELILGVNGLKVATKCFRLTKLGSYIQKASARMTTAEIIEYSVAF